jgi:RND family efflux transporter MFP subunit
MKNIKIIVAIVILSLATAVWILRYHNPWVLSWMPKAKPIQALVGSFGAASGETAAADEDPDNTKNLIPVHTAHVTVATLHDYIDGYGTIAPRPPRTGEMAGSASIASPVPGVVGEVLTQIGQHVNKGDALIQLDDRLAKAVEDQAQAALTQAKESLANLKASRPQTLEIAQLAVTKARSTADSAQKNVDRENTLVRDGSISANDKGFQQAATDLASAKSDLEVTERQFALAESSNSNGTFAEDSAKVASAEFALASAKTQRQMMRIVAPIDGTVVQMNVNPGEGVDPTKTLVQVIALDRLLVDVDVPAEQLPSLSLGLPVIVMPVSSSTSKPSSSDMPAPQGKVTTISPDVNPKTGTVRVDIDLPADSTFRPGLSVLVRIIDQEHKDKLAVPKAAVTTDENGDSFIATLDGEQATHKTVQVGLEENGLVEIDADGVKEGDTVITAGAYGLPPATHVKVVD